MLHAIKLRATGTFVLIPADKGQRLERVCPKVGTVIKGEVRCYVTANMVEVADIRLADGSGVLAGVPCEYFCFLDRQEG
jgi:hypothetical protein